MIRYRAAGCIADAGELEQQAAASGIRDTPAVLGELRIDQRPALCPKRGERTFFFVRGN